MKLVMVVTAAIAVSALISCKPTSSDQQQDNSGLQEIDLNLPKRDALPPAIAAKLTAYRLTIIPNVAGNTAALALASGTTPSCSATAADTINMSGLYDDKAVLSAKLKHGCVYKVSLDVGYLDSSPKAPVYTVWYLGSAIADTTTVTGPSMSLSIQLKLDPDRATDVASLPANVAAPNTVVAPPTVVTPPPSPSTPPAAATRSPDVDLQVNAKLPCSGSDCARSPGDQGGTPTSTPTVTPTGTATATPTGTTNSNPTATGDSSAVTASITYAANIKPIVDTACGKCHAGVQSPNLSTYDGIRQAATKVMQEVVNRSMPPATETQLAPADINLLQKWASAGFPQ